ncbi:MAG TPA: response regulator [Candidatus Saccharimonadales bacterium]|nr:response regulator [Candidatus Saccharimonadales bacterium]
MNILLIEPDQVLGRTYQRALKAAGHKVLSCTSAQAAIALIDQLKPDLVILELQLVAHGGIEFLYEFRSYKDWLDIPVVALSSIPPGEFNGSWRLLQDGLGVKAYHYKPLTKLKDLIRTVNSFATIKT